INILNKNLRRALMLQFKKYLKQKLEEKEFCQAYDDNCNMCQTVWQIVDIISNSVYSWADISKETGLPESDLIDFANGDRCQPHIIETLCQKYDIDLPAECPRFKF
ncbi:MAG: hypothetical protein P9X26_07280, partial [Candidatus Stygibacter frigidus]|nr:hypothetical protein [Candidatus Stygibacter frigidus]